jgi:tetratricopeptide (TPR) repeat protein
MAVVGGVVGFICCVLLATPGHEANSNKKPSSALSGVVLSMQDQPLAGVAVKLEPTDGGDLAPTATTDDKGEFSIELQVGEYVLKLSRDGFLPFEGPISIPEDQQQSVRVQMLDASMGQRNVAIGAYNAGVEAYRAGDVVAAIRHLQESAAADSTFAEPLSLLADLHFARGSFAESAEAAERYLSLEPDDREIQARAYQAHLRAGNQAKVDEWRTLLSETGAARQMAIDAYNEGARASQDGNVDAAVERFQIALDLDPGLAEAHAGLAAIHYNQSCYDDALAAVERALALKPDHATSLRTRFLIHDHTGNRMAADAALGAWAAVDTSGAVELLSGRAEIHFRAGRRRDAEAALLKVLEIEPDRAPAHYRLGLMYAQDDTEKARKHLERFIALAPTAPEVATAKQLMATF